MAKNPSLFGEPQLELLDHVTAMQPTRRVQGGLATTDVILSAHVAGNAEVFNQVADLHIPSGSVIADLTYGKGVFWQQIPTEKYRLIFSDLDAKVSQDPGQSHQRFLQAKRVSLRGSFSGLSEKMQSRKLLCESSNRKNGKIPRLRSE